MRSLFLCSILCCLVFAAATAGWIGYYVTAKGEGTGKVTISIPRGSGVRTIKTILARNGIIRDDIRFLIMARFVHEAKQLKAGEFQVPLGMTPLEVIRFLASAKPVQYRVTVPEGWTMQQVARAFAKDGWIDEKIFLQLCHDPSFIASLEITADSLEGYLFPETYALVRGSVTEKTVILSMVQRFFQVWNRLEKPEKLTLNRHQLVTLASIVEKETGSASERPLIAGVFYNRLNKGMRLQSDPTTIYGIKDFNGNLTRKDLKEATAYNTYVVAGLPPGPICNPGKAALHAVLYPETTKKLYFVAKNDGSHHFSSTLAEHNRAVYQYQKRRNKRITRHN
jgi:UPF0755 protein